MQKIQKGIVDDMAVLVAAAGVIGALVPSAFAWAGSYVSWLLGLVMFGMGMTLSAADFRRVLARPRYVAIGVFAQFLIMPLVAYVLVRAFRLPPELAVGVILLGTCPGGTASNVISYLARGDVALSVSMTMTTTLLAPVVTPALTYLLAGATIEVTEQDSAASGYNFEKFTIDGTDVYSQGFPSWCVSVGILDGDKVPVGAMICAPRFGIATSGGLFVRLDPGGTLLVDGKQFAITTEKETTGQVVMGSDAIRHMTVERFSGKIRCFGSTIIHLLCPVLVDKIHAAIQSVGYVWDFASAHAVLRASGMDIYHADGSPFTYTDAFLDRQPVRECLYAGTKACTDRLRQVLTARTP